MPLAPRSSGWLRRNVSNVAVICFPSRSAVSRPRRSRRPSTMPFWQSGSRNEKRRLLLSKPRTKSEAIHLIHRWCLSDNHLGLHEHFLLLVDVTSMYYIALSCFLPLLYAGHPNVMRFHGTIYKIGLYLWSTLIVMDYAHIALNFSYNSLNASSSTWYTRQSLSVTPRGRENVGASPCMSSSSTPTNPLPASKVSSSRSTSASFDAFVSNCSIAPRMVASESTKSFNRYLETALASDPKENERKVSPYVASSDAVCGCECRHLPVHVKVVDISIQGETTLMPSPRRDEALHRGCGVFVEVDSRT